MKKHIKMIALLAISSVLLSSCMVPRNGQHGKGHDRDKGRNEHHRDGDHNNRNDSYHRY